MGLASARRFLLAGLSVAGSVYSALRRRLDPVGRAGRLSGRRSKTRLSAPLELILARRPVRWQTSNLDQSGPGGPHARRRPAATRSQSCAAMDGQGVNFGAVARRHDIEIDFTKGGRFPCPHCAKTECSVHDRHAYVTTPRLLPAPGRSYMPVRRALPAPRLRRQADRRATGAAGFRLHAAVLGARHSADDGDADRQVRR